MNPCEQCGTATNLIVDLSGDIMPLCRTCLEQVKESLRRRRRKRQREFGEPTAGDLFTPQDPRKRNA
jgi:hypothetical protein